MLRLRTRAAVSKQRGNCLQENVLLIPYKLMPNFSGKNPQLENLKIAAIKRMQQRNDHYRA
jgi:hypothetical protein